MPKLVKKAKDTELDFIANAQRIASIAADFKALGIKALDVRGLTLVADCFVLCSAASEPQIKAIYNGVKDGMKEIGVSPLQAEGAFSGGWLVLDYGTILFHIFKREAREFYDLDGLWGDAPALELDLEP